jgi:hypothetical protein
MQNDLFYDRGRKMGAKPTWERHRSRGPHDAIIGAVAVGAVFILIGLVFVLALPNNLWDKTFGFFSNLTTREAPRTGITLIAPANPGAHAVFYNAVFQFSLGIAFLQVVILALRLGLGSRIGRIAETIGNLVFWVGASYLVNNFLNNSTNLTAWFSFWAAIIIVVGLSIVARVLVLMAKR